MSAQQQAVIWVQILVGAIIAARIFFVVNTRTPRSRLLQGSSVVVVSVAITTIVGFQIEQGDRAGIWKDYVAPMLLLSSLLAVEGFLIAAWLTAQRLRFAVFLPLYLLIAGLAALVTSVVTAGLYPGS